MSPPRRRSARLASASTPKPKAQSSLSSLVEQEEGSSPAPSPTTPASSAIKPPKSEMHPTKAHPSANGDAGTWLGFRDIKSADVSRGKTATDPQATPSKPSGMPSTPFTFNVSRQADLGLSAPAQRMMEELRADTERIKADLMAQREREKQNEEATGRKFAKARGRSGRFSAAHMAEFKKMDSIENHPSSFRAQAGRFTPVKAGALKRSSSKADLDEAAAVQTTPKTTLKRTHSKADLHETPSLQLKSALKRTASKNSLTDRANALTSSVAKARNDAAMSPSKMASAYAPESPSPVKRVRKQIEDDVSTYRPTSRDGASAIPRPKSSGNDAPGAVRPNTSLASFLSPTKSTTVRQGAATPGQYPKLPTFGLTKSASKPDLAAAAAKPTPSKPFGTLTKSASKSDLVAAAKPGTLIKPASRSDLAGPSKPTPSRPFGTLTNFTSKPDLATAAAAKPTPSKPFGSLTRKTTELKNRVISPGRFEKVKSILKGARTASGNVQTAIPGPSTVSQTPAPQAAPKIVAPVPFTTPRRKLFKRVDFTPDTKGPARDNFGEVSYPNLDAVLGRIPKEDAADVTSPTPTTSQRPLPEPPVAAEPVAGPGPSTFTFRSEQTMRFGSGSPAAFGSSPGQSSIRTVRPSLPLQDLPGSFPGEAMETDLPNVTDRRRSASRSPIKATLEEGVPHGLTNEKRARADTLESHPNKENQVPAAPIFSHLAHGIGNEKRNRAHAAASHNGKLFKSPAKPMPTFAHGLSNKKRARATDDEVDADQEGADRGGKRRKASGGSASVPSANMKLPRTIPTPSKVRAGSATPTSVKKRLGMTMSRLNALAQPKRR
ncbi:hypothetical protein F5X68DRAFT_9489 [Plectosphaerella plurivora]|uniref:Erythromycin esterase n=1 Tax=Plectosphaerella plurivora TaxID=936078 RepID=A0A9P8VC13_9PEZI|nr:hypothetical protein F5X68DRAFT_9489 [Plectosphaerella plurivora]